MGRRSKNKPYTHTRHLPPCPGGGFAANGMWAGQDTQKNMFWESNFDNVSAFNVYWLALRNIATSRVEWEGIPDTVDQRFLEEVLFFNGAALYSADEIMGQMVSAFAGVGNRDIYNKPIVRDVYTPNGYHHMVTDRESVIIYNNYSRLPDVFAVNYFSGRLWELDQIIDVNCRAQKTPVAVRATKEQQLAMKNMWMQFDGNMPAIFIDNNVLDFNNGNAIECVKTDAPFVADKIQVIKEQVWSQALMWLGVDSAPSFKKEQLVSAEVRQQSGGTAAFRAAFMKPREDAAKEINKMFGTDIQPMWNATVMEQMVAMPNVSAVNQAAEVSTTRQMEVGA